MFLIFQKIQQKEKIKKKINKIIRNFGQQFYKIEPNVFDFLISFILECNDHWISICYYIFLVKICSNQLFRSTGDDDDDELGRAALFVNL